MTSVFIANALFASKMVSFLALKLLTGKPALSHGRVFSRVTVCVQKTAGEQCGGITCLSSIAKESKCSDLEWKPTKYCWLLFKCLNPSDSLLCKENASPSATPVHSKIPGDVYLLLLENLCFWVCAGVLSRPECYSANEGSGPLHLLFSLSGIQ